ncbi:Rcf2p KNAG_0D00510 [Huiozyma naganishii CBS 8797]|uniref:HIG1 domain-containing protein n=1 Tax=Huiozyma naganishii (strain ATCC MYA-139 / BCRC 22969 / CBS 8797 / KCTC 17520 / NBRC 10181 / NCYC 3082 / Yp74L-3) TaxID=1071383 RepID=J7RJW8_HUIN7|nr:hypothetical protein KNAG_0D00510 [Kazachstania naganishii CBS 8797]CCK69803.1 hypothetical protein KNAG_0D00510 [Kazachstania naganishii CBS 8797]
MKILTSQEIKDHSAYTLKGGLYGCLAGLAVSGLVFRLGPRRFPRFQPQGMPWSIRTALFIAPPTLLTAIFAEEASNKFDSLTYSGDYNREQSQRDRLEREGMSLKDRAVASLSVHKYKIITTLWAGSLWGSWVLVNRDKIMTKAQKAVQARMYAQFVTVVLLLASVVLSQYENKLQPDKGKDREHQRWEQALKAAELQEKRVGGASFSSNEDRINAKIFK